MRIFRSRHWKAVEANSDGRDPCHIFDRVPDSETEPSVRLAVCRRMLPGFVRRAR